ncbi:MAG: hypothetical protein KBC50_00695 [Candidatus Pacebacteria bacterium]|nr:hypothetical protein [Candidatus Paceibacterota bacterium]
MQTIKPFINNLRHAGPLVIILAALAGYVANMVWYYIPFISNIYFGDTVPPTFGAMPFAILAWYIGNCILNTIGVALLINKKGAWNGFLVGLIVSLFFSGTAYLASYLGAGTPLPPLEISLIITIGSLLFYAVPSTLIGYLRKE